MGTGQDDECYVAGCDVSVARDGLCRKHWHSMAFFGKRNFEKTLEEIRALPEDFTAREEPS